MIMRPDERTAEAEIERDKQFRGNIGKAVKTVAGAGIAAGLGASGIASKVLPWLSTYIPVDLAMKGLRKVSPKVADFLDRGRSMGLDVKEGMEYVKDQFDQSKKPAKDQRNILQQYSPELHTFIETEIQRGRTPIEAAAMAQYNKEFDPIIKKLTKDHKTPWSKIVEDIFGNGHTAQPNQAQQQQQMQEQSQQQGQGQGAQLLTSILEKINQGLGP